MASKKVMAGLLSVSILSLSAGLAFADNITNIKLINNPNVNRDVIEINMELEEEIKINMGYFTGKVKEIREFDDEQGTKSVLVENEDGQLANFIISDDTYILDNTKIEVGNILTGFYDKNLPMIMIYPSQYKAEIIVVEKEGLNVKLDMFNEDLISSDNSLKLNISDDTKILLQDGTVFKNDLKNRNLIVVYGVSTRSIPAQTSPSKVIVLFEDKEQVEDKVEDEEVVNIMNDVSSMELIVEGKRIDAPSAYRNQEGTVMLPLRAIAEALGYEVTWQGETQSVMIGKGISLTIGKDYYTYMKTTPIKLGTAPEIFESKTYVPLNFFREVLKMNNAYVFEGQIVIDNSEKFN